MLHGGGPCQIWQSDISSSSHHLNWTSKESLSVIPFRAQMKGTAMDKKHTQHEGHGSKSSASHGGKKEPTRNRPEQSGGEAASGTEHRKDQHPMRKGQ